MTRRPRREEGASAEAGAPSLVSAPNLKDGNDPFYSYPAMSKKSHLAIQEIYQYQDMSSAEISSVFFQLGVQKAAILFHLMLQSFKITARAANAGWKIYQGLSKLDFKERVFVPPSIIDDLGRALHDYSPDNFHPHLGDLEFAADCFEQFYNEASTLQTKEEVEELLFQWTARLKGELEAKVAAMPPSTTIEEVVTRAKRSPVTGSE